MNIAEAKTRYQQQGENAVSPAFRGLINQMIDNNTKTEFANDSYLDALYLTDVMFERSTKSICLFTGPSGGSFLEILETSFVETLKRLASNGGTVRLVLLANSVPDRVKALEEQFHGCFQVALAHSVEPVRHFIVCDSKMSRLEEVHGSIEETSDASVIKARVSFNDPTKAKYLEDFFDEVWKVVTKFPINRSAVVA